MRSRTNDGGESLQGKSIRGGKGNPKLKDKFRGWSGRLDIGKSEEKRVETAEWGTWLIEERKPNGSRKDEEERWWIADRGKKKLYN